MNKSLLIVAVVLLLMTVLLSICFLNVPDNALLGFPFFISLYRGAALS